MKPPYLENVSSHRGAPMGRREIIPTDYNGGRLHLRRVPFVGGCYDPGGAYWGSPADLWCAWGETVTEQLQIFTRADSRDSAKAAISTRFNERGVTAPAFYR